MSKENRKKICFVISPIGKEGSSTRIRSNKVFEDIIEPAAQECDYEAKRADMVSRPGIITSQIIQYLREEPLVIADLSESDPNVFYELAIRHVTRKPVVQIIDINEELPFDVRATNTISFDYMNKDSIEKCKQEIVQQIKAVEDDPSKVDAPFSFIIDPNTTSHKTEDSVFEFMLELVSSGSTLDIVAEQLSWISKNKDIKSKLISRAKSGVEINIYLPRENAISNELKDKNIQIHICPDLAKSPYARFTLVDKNNPGAIKLAVGFGTYPNFKISEFNETSNAQVIAMARDYVNSLGKV